MRVHELAKQLGVPSKMLLAELRDMDVEVKNHMSTEMARITVPTRAQKSSLRSGPPRSACGIS